jgi:nitroreductase
MDLEQMIVKRVSIRVWEENKPVEKEKIEKVLDAAQQFPPILNMKCSK